MKILALVQKKSPEEQKLKDSKRNISTVSFYDFENSTKELYTVQIAASRQYSNIKFDKVKDVFSYFYNDGYNRYFSSVFLTRKEAEVYKTKLIKSGFQDAFVVGLKGKTRF
jgi:hypothetical protein